MFEKESEIYALSNFGFRGKNSQRVLTAKIDYQYGAEFGYNKANEWHYVKDGDLPKEEKEYLVIFESDGTKYKSLESYYPDTKEWSTICKIIAWKEIVLPELKESE